MTRAIVAAAALALAAASPARAAESAESGVEIGARLGYAFPAGSLGAAPNLQDNDVSNYVSGLVPLWLDAGYRFNHEAYLGAYFTYGLGLVNDDRQDGCRNANVNCSASDVRLGVMGRFHFPPLAQFSPWLGLGIGYEWGTFSLDLSAVGLPNTEFGYSGWEFANFQLGADYKVAPKVAIAPFVSVSIDRFSDLSTTLTTANDKNTTDQELAKKSIHSWILIGARVAIAP
jgi:opacity protein-like surface antigen